MNRPAHVWSAFALAALLLAAAVGWISAKALELSRSEAAALARSEVEENIRLALWRMDSTVGALVAQESARPFYASSEDVPYVLLQFQVDERGEVTAPKGTASTPERLARLRAILRPDELRTAFPPGREVVEDEEPLPAQAVEQQSNAFLQNSLERSANEYRARSMNAVKSRAFSKTRAPAPRIAAPAAPRVSAGAIKPIWMSSELILARSVSERGRRSVQGCWIDWATLKRDLEQSVHDLLPLAVLEPIAAGVPAIAGRALASIPVQLVPGGAPLAAPAFSFTGLRDSPLGLSLIAAWGAVALAACAVAALLLGVLSLSERRAAFVSAVTHELRTPLTTFRLYTDLLAQDLIQDPEKKKSYLETLRREAERLGHLVENVLAYARLERGRSGRRLEPVGLSALVERCRPRLEERTRAAGLELALTLPDDLAVRQLVTDTAAVEQVLFNLVDNACKYAATAGDRRLDVALAATARATTVSVRDRGPGISRREARALFQPFSRSAEQATGSAPGVGLGLALSRQLARQIGGDLKLVHADGPGALFVLTLPPPAP